MTKITNIIGAFVREEDGIALTEYLILLGILIGGVIVAVGAVAGDLSAAWDSWSGWFGSNLTCDNPGAPDCAAG